jgi:hypothetical protein
VHTADVLEKVGFNGGSFILNMIAIIAKVCNFDKAKMDQNL